MWNLDIPALLDDPSSANLRAAMIDQVLRHAHATRLEGTPIALDPRVIDVMRRLPRHLFAPAVATEDAYEDTPVPIGHRQTMSQPFIVALMTSLARLGPHDRVLEVGTGSGYQAAVLAALVAEVYSIEFIAPLAEEAAGVLDRLCVPNVETRIGDGYAGWPEKAPFHAILVTAAADEVPEALLAQLEAGGRLVIPVGESRQELLLIEKAPDGSAVSRTVIPVRFVPLVHGEEADGPGR